MSLCRKFESAYADLGSKDIMDISEETGCDKPCKYRKYRLTGKQQLKSAGSDSARDFGLWAISNYTTVGTAIHSSS